MRILKPLRWSDRAASPSTSLLFLGFSPSPRQTRECISRNGQATTHALRGRSWLIDFQRITVLAAVRPIRSGISLHTSARARSNGNVAGTARHRIGISSGAMRSYRSIRRRIKIAPSSNNTSRARGPAIKCKLCKRREGDGCSFRGAAYRDLLIASV